MKKNSFFQVGDNNDVILNRDSIAEVSLLHTYGLIERIIITKSLYDAVVKSQYERALVIRYRNGSTVAVAVPSKEGLKESFDYLKGKLCD